MSVQSDVDDVVVIGKVMREVNGTALPPAGWVSYTAVTAPAPVGSDYGENVAGWGDTEEYSTASVTIELEHGEFLEGAESAAVNVARGLARLKDYLSDLDPDTTVYQRDGYTMTAGQLLTLIDGTKFIISDQADFGNDGVGSADAVNNTDTLYYGAYDGLSDNNWASPNYQNDEGLIGIILHELGNLSDYGYAFELENRYYYELEIGNLANYVGSDYFNNSESLQRTLLMQPLPHSAKISPRWTFNTAECPFNLPLSMRSMPAERPTRIWCLGFKNDGLITWRLGDCRIPGSHWSHRGRMSAG